MNTALPLKDKSSSFSNSFFYGWIIVAACTTLLVMNSGLNFSFGVFFKPLIADFGWSRAVISGVISARWLVLAAFVIPIGRLTDKFGPAKIMGFCGLMIGLGLVLTSQVNSLWQLYLTYGLIFGIGASGTFSITTSTTARWFFKRQGLALGIVSSGVGLGTLTIVPLTERLITAFDWSRAFLILGISAWMIMITGALLLRRNPDDVGQLPYGMEEPIIHPSEGKGCDTAPVASKIGVGLRIAARTKSLWMIFLIVLLLSISMNMVMLHLVNYATDLHISSLISAIFVSIIGAGGIIGRLAMGSAADRIGASNALAICCVILTATLFWLVFSREPWMFFLFSVIFGFAYGGEIPQIPILVSQFFGFHALAALVATVTAALGIGGALGSWLGGQIFDITGSYQIAFTIAALASLCSLVITLMLKKERSQEQGAVHTVI